MGCQSSRSLAELHVTGVFAKSGDATSASAQSGTKCHGQRQAANDEARVPAALETYQLRELGNRKRKFSMKRAFRQLNDVSIA